MPRISLVLAWQLISLSIATYGFVLGPSHRPSFHQTSDNVFISRKPMCRYTLANHHIFAGRQPNRYMQANSGESNNQHQSINFVVGTDVEVKWDNEWWVAQITGIDGVQNRIKVEFDGAVGEELWIDDVPNNIRPFRRHTANKLHSFYSNEELKRHDDTPDDVFWRKGGPRASDMDEDFFELLLELHTSFIAGGAKILDLGADARTALHSNVPFQQVEGVGLVAEHLQRNPLLASWSCVNLNANPVLPYGAGDFDAVICSCTIPYLQYPGAVIAEAARVLKKSGTLVVSWTTEPAASKAVLGWTNRNQSEQVELVKAMMQAAGFHAPSIRVDVSGPTGGAKLCVVSGGLSAPQPRAVSLGGLVVEDAVHPRRLMHSLKEKARSRRDYQRQKEHDDKPFKVRVTSPPPARLLEGEYHLHPRTHNGDRVAVDGAEYVVTRVELVFMYTGGRYRIQHKILDVLPSRRLELTQALDRLLPD